MPSYTLADILTLLLSPSPAALGSALLVAFGLPLLFHYVIYTSISRSLPTFILVGPSGGGKTSLHALVRPQPLLSISLPTPLPVH